jgi:hypothetical protein
MVEKGHKKRVRDSQLREKIIARAWKDPEFKRRLLQDPKETLREIGANLPEAVVVRVFEDRKDLYNLVVPLSPADVNELTEKELLEIAAANAGEDLNILLETPQQGL